MYILTINPNGLTMEHMKEIEELLGVYVPDQYDIEPPSDPLPAPGSIKLIDREIYKTIKKEIGGVPEKKRSLNHYLLSNIFNKLEKSCIFTTFMYFAKYSRLSVAVSLKGITGNGKYYTPIINDGDR